MGIYIYSKYCTWYCINGDIYIPNFLNKWNRNGDPYVSMTGHTRDIENIHDSMWAYNQQQISVTVMGKDTFKRCQDRQSCSYKGKNRRVRLRGLPTTKWWLGWIEFEMLLQDALCKVCQESEKTRQTEQELYSNVSKIGYTSGDLIAPRTHPPPQTDDYPSWYMIHAFH